MNNPMIEFRGMREDNKEWVYGWLAEPNVINVEVRNVKYYVEVMEDILVIPETVGMGIVIDGKKFFEGDIVKGTFRLQTGTRTKYRGRKKVYYDEMSNVEVIGQIIWNEKKGAFWFHTDTSTTYKTHFYSGMGRTLSEKKANEWVEIKDNPSNYLWEVARKLEIIGNIHEEIKEKEQ